MTSTDVNCCTDFYRAVYVGSLDDLYEILGKTERKIMSNLAQSYNEMGETPLLVAINKRHPFVVQFLVDILEIDISQVGRFSWKDSNYLNIPPLFAAIISDQMSITNYLIETKKDAVNLDLFMKGSTTTRLDKINVLELIGAAYILHGVRDSHLRGLIYWEKAEILGQHVIVDGSSISKTFISYLIVFFIMENSLDAMTLEEAEEKTKNRLIIQQALYVGQQVLERLLLFPNIYIISKISKFMTNSDLNSRFRTHEDLENLSNISIYVLKQLNKWWENDSASCVSMETWDVNKEALNYCWGSIRLLHKDITSNSTLLFPNFMFVFSFASEHLNRVHAKYWPANQKDRDDALYEMTKIVCHISVSIMHVLPQLSSKESKQFKTSLARYIHLYEEWETDKPYVFHRACNLPYLVGQKTNYEQVIQLFLEAGADPNAVNADGNTPLQCLLPKNEFQYWLTNPWDSPNEKDVPIIRSNFIASVRVLLDAGSHVDQSNRRGETILELLKRNRKMQQSFKAPFDPFLESVIDSVLPLTCYCAQSIRKNNIPIVKLPPTLQLFVRRH